MFSQVNPPRLICLSLREDSLFASYRFVCAFLGVPSRMVPAVPRRLTLVVNPGISVPLLDVSRLCSELFCPRVFPVSWSLSQETPFAWVFFAPGAPFSFAFFFDAAPDLLFWVS